MAFSTCGKFFSDTSLLSQSLLTLSLSLEASCFNEWLYLLLLRGKTRRVNEREKKNDWSHCKYNRKIPLLLWQRVNTWCVCMFLFLSFLLFFCCSFSYHKLVYECFFFSLFYYCTAVLTMSKVTNKCTNGTPARINYTLERHLLFTSLEVQ